tara:strand:+ start:47814 stop:48035 length:222 start_codon:yes stop_codon:yes gene_type:complete
MQKLNKNEISENDKSEIIGFKTIKGNVGVHLAGKCYYLSYNKDYGYWVKSLKKALKMAIIQCEKLATNKININ